MLGKIIGTAKKVATTAVKATPAYQVGSAVKKSGWGKKLLLASPAGLALTALVGDKKPMAAAQGEYPPMRSGAAGGYGPLPGSQGNAGGSIAVVGGPLPVGPPVDGAVVGGGVGIGPGGAQGPGVGPRAGGGGAILFQ